MKIGRKRTDNSEKARLQAAILTIEAHLNLIDQVRPTRDKKLEDISKSLSTLAPRKATSTPPAGQGVSFRVMHNLVPTNRP